MFRLSGKRKSAIGAAVAVCIMLVVSSCAGLNAFGEEISRAFNGVPATMTSYTQGGELVDEVYGESFRVSRDQEFDSTNEDGTSNADSSVMLISLGSSHINHVGSTLVLAQDGLTEVAGASTTISFESYERGTPWLNDLIETHRNLWEGKGKTIMIRSQDGTPIAVYAGEEVEKFSTDVPKSTAFRVDGKYLFVYQADYDVYDNDLLTKK